MATDSRGNIVGGLVGFLALCLVGFAGIQSGWLGGGAASSAPDAASSTPSEPSAPPFVPPPRSGPETWSMPGLWQRHPPFPFLPGENRTKSRSIGGVVHGHLVHSVAIPQPHPAVAFLDVQHDRKLYYTTDRMRDIVLGAARHVREHFPEAVVWLGNFGNPGGGDIPYSVSHNSGRDADFAFFLKDSEGEPAVPSDLVPVDEEGRYEGDEGSFRFDVAKNWRLIEGLIEAGGDQLQYIFVSRPLKRDLLARAREVGAPLRVRRRARRLLHQPYGSLPHNDHFHVRIYCSKLDVESGCWDRGTKHPWYDEHAGAESEAVERAQEALAADEPRVRVRGARRLALLEAQRSRSRLVERLDDADPRVRAASARALGRLGRDERALGRRLDREEHPQAYLELVDALSRIGGSYATRTLTAELAEGRRIRTPGGEAVDARVFVSEALIRLERERPVDRLVELLDADSPDLRTAAARALHYLTNHKFGDQWGAREDRKWEDELAKWEEWLDRYGDDSRETWLREGFEAAGFDVDHLDGNHVWELCEAVEDENYLSHNAQRVLMQISGREPASLSWPKDDANFYWRRWFERRRRRFGVPPVPEGMSTLD